MSKIDPTFFHKDIDFGSLVLAVIGVLLVLLPPHHYPLVENIVAFMSGTLFMIFLWSVRDYLYLKWKKENEL